MKISAQPAYRLVLLRHGQSQWNLEDKFSGWTDVGLTEKGKQEAVAAGELMRRYGFNFEQVFTSVLSRAVHTAVLAGFPPTQRSWKLNERHYGALQGENKTDMISRVGPDQVDVWRRSFDVPPPSLTLDDPRHPQHDPLYADVPRAELPAAESLEDTLHRVVPYYRSDIQPALKESRDVLVVAHGNSLRSLVKHLDGISDADIAHLDIPNGKPLVYELDENLEPLRSYYLEEGGSPPLLRPREAAVTV